MTRVLFDSPSAAAPAGELLKERARKYRSLLKRNGETTTQPSAAGSPKWPGAET